MQPIQASLCLMQTGFNTPASVWSISIQIMSWIICDFSATFSLLTTQINNKSVIYKTTIYMPAVATVSQLNASCWPKPCVFRPRTLFFAVSSYFLSMCNYCPPVVKDTYCRHSCIAPGAHFCQNTLFKLDQNPKTCLLSYWSEMT